MTISYQTDPFLCPYAPGFVDFFRVFAGCYFPENIHQTYVIQGHRCGIRQYLNNGSCIDVDSSCNTFNPLTGDCLTCWENSKTAIRGSCNSSVNTAPVPSCAIDTHLFQNQCISDNCSAAYQNGSCSACANTAFRLTSGQCVEIQCSIGLYFSVALN